MRRRLALVAVNVLVFIAFAELVSLGIYYAQNGTLFYTHRKVYELIPETEAGELTADRLHPYFGPTHRPGHPFNYSKELGRPVEPAATNNFGFVSPLDYPFLRTNPYQFIVGIFGGSVGVWFCQLGVDRLIADLKQQPYFSKRDLIVLCLSHEGYKQPQQLQVLSYFLSIGQEFDVVVNIDGFNEVALSRLNNQQGLDISMPSVVHLGPLINLVNQSSLTPAKLQSLAAIGRRKQELNQLSARINRNRLASVNFVLEQYYKRVSGQYQTELQIFSTLPDAAAESLIYATPSTKQRSGNGLYEDIAASWVRSSILMNDLLAARGAKYVHVLQPNQYATRRRFTAAEAGVALSAESPFKEGVEHGYPELLKAAAAEPRFRNAIGFMDATGIFDHEPSQVYIDNCCHYTLGGNRLLADYIASGISQLEWAGRR